MSKYVTVAYRSLPYLTVWTVSAGGMMWGNCGRAAGCSFAEGGSGRGHKGWDDSERGLRGPARFLSEQEAQRAA